MEINTLSPDSVQTDTNAPGVQANLPNYASFRDHADSWLSFLADIEVDEINLLLLLPVPILSEEARRLGLPEDSCAAVSGQSKCNLSAHIQG